MQPFEPNRSADDDSLLHLFEILQLGNVLEQEDAISQLMAILDSSHFAQEQQCTPVLDALAAGLSSPSLQVQTGAAELLKGPLIFESCQERFLETGALQRLLDIIREAAQKASHAAMVAAQAAAAALTILARNKDALELVVKQGGVEPLIQLLDVSSESLPRACGALPDSSLRIRSWQEGCQALQRLDSSANTAGLSIS